MSKLLKSKFLLGVLVVTVFAVGGVALMANDASADCAITTTLRQGSAGAEVQCLQTLVGVTADGKFGPMTAAAVKAWQTSKGLVADGVFGPMSRAAMGGSVAGLPAGCSSTSGYSTTTGQSCSSGSSLPAGCSSTAGYSPTTGAKCDSSTAGDDSSGPLTGGAGDITVSALSSYGDEQVGEDEEDAPVLAFEAEADEDSDVDISSVKVELNQQNTADDEDIDAYMEAVSVFMGDEKVGEADVEDFSETTGHIWQKSISLDNAVIRAGETEKFSLRVSSLANIDSGDMDSDDWQIGVSSIRFLDGEGVSSTDSFTLDIDDNVVDDTLEEEFDFASFASASNVELKVALKTGDAADDINKSHLINVETGTEDTDDVAVLDFTLEAKGSDINVSEIPVLFATTGDTNEGNLLAAAHLWMEGDDEGDYVATESVADGGAVTFDELDIDIDEGDKVEFKVYVDLQDLTGNLDEGDGVQADMTGTEVDAIEAEDASGTDLAAADLTGTAGGEESYAYDVTFTLDTDGWENGNVLVGGFASEDDAVDFTLSYDVTAVDGDVYIDDTCTEDADGTLVAGDAADGFNYSQTDGTDANIALTCSLTTGATAGANGTYKVNQGETETIQVTIHAIADVGDSFVQLTWEGLGWSEADEAGDRLFEGSLDDNYKSSSVYLEQRA